MDVLVHCEYVDNSNYHQPCWNKARTFVRHHACDYTSLDVVGGEVCIARVAFDVFASDRNGCLLRSRSSHGAGSRTVNVFVLCFHSFLATWFTMPICKFPLACVSCMGSIPRPPTFKIGRGIRIRLHLVPLLRTDMPVVGLVSSCVCVWHGHPTSVDPPPTPACLTL